MKQCVRPGCTLYPDFCPEGAGESFQKCCILTRVEKREAQTKVDRQRLYEQRGETSVARIAFDPEALTRMVFGTGGALPIATPTAETAAEALAALHHERQAVVLSRRAGGQTLAAIGLLLGVTRYRVRQIEQKALRRLRHPTLVAVLRGATMNEIREAKRG